MKNILISVPSLQPKSIYLPYIWGVLKTYAERDETIKKNYRWVDPIFSYRADVDDLVKPYLNYNIDVLGLSCYVWNWRTNLEIAKAIKRINPACLVVAGGPQFSWSEQGLIDKIEVVDIIVKKEGEEPFTQILRESLKDSPDYSLIPNLILRSDKHTPENLPYLDLSDIASPYISQSDKFQEYIDLITINGEDPHVIWETNRGCPFKCTFCDWGSNTNSKIRRFNMKRLGEEAKWFSEIKTHTVFIVDANYGMLERDEKTARWLVNGKRSTGYPKFVLFNPTKNRQNVAAKITKMFYDSGIFSLNMVNFQHTKKDVLDAMDRSNIKIDKLMEPMLEQWEVNMPISAIIIQGSPGDTIELWKDCHQDLLEWGFHEDILSYDFAILPNAPAATPEYRKKWGIKTVYRPIPDYRILKKYADSPNRNFCEFIVETNTYDQDAWIKMKLWTVMIQGLHNYAATRFIAFYLRHYCEIQYVDFYNWIFEQFSNHSILRGIFEAVINTIKIYLEDPKGEMFIDCHEHLSFISPLDHFIFFRAVINKEAFYQDLSNLIQRNCQVDKDILEDLLRFQKNIIITPDYNFNEGRRFTVKYNWLEIFSSILLTKPVQKPALTELRPKEETIDIYQKTSGYLGRSRLSFDSLEDYYTKIIRVGYMRNFTAYFRNAILEKEELFPKSFSILC